MDSLPQGTRLGLSEVFKGDCSSQQCRKCGCTDLNCSRGTERTGLPCYWVEPDLCSACAFTGLRFPHGHVVKPHFSLPQ